MIRTLARQPPAPPGHGKNLRIFVEYKNAVTADEALSMAQAAGVTIASNKELTRVLVGSEDWKAIGSAFACWSGTMTAYDKPDKKIGKTIEYVDSNTGITYVFPVPEEQVGKKNVVLVVEHPNFMIETDGKTKVVIAKEVGIVPELPIDVEGKYFGDAKYDIPTGTEVYPNCGCGCNKGKKVTDYYSTRRICRLEKRVGLVARDADSYSGITQLDICIATPPFKHFGVVVVDRDCAPETKFDEPSGQHPYRSELHANGWQDAARAQDLPKPDILKRLSLALGFS